MLDLPTWTPLLPISGCPPSYPGCGVELPPLPDSMVLTIRVALGCAVALAALALVVAGIFTVTHGWRWRRALTVAAIAACGGLCLLLAQKASDAYQPFARLHVPAGTSYDEWVIRAGSGPVWNYAPTIAGFRGWLVLLVFVAVGLTATAFVQAARTIHKHR